VGEHDFKSFCSVHTQAQTTVRTVTGIEVIEKPCAEEQAAMLAGQGAETESAQEQPARRGVSPREIVIRVSGTGFLYNMVRIIAGTLMEAGRGAIEPEQVKSILEACDRSKAGPTAPPEGLTLVRYRILKKSSQKLQKNEETN
jgi:tRNA pseudouridine38-40 synthase